jgi:hypothetical protein
MAVVYNKSELGTFLEQLPNLVMQYQRVAGERAHDEAMLERKLEHEEKMFRDKQEYDANLTAYGDAKAVYRENKQALDALELQYQQTGADIGHLPEIYNTGGALEALGKITEIPAKDWAQRADYWESMADQLETKHDRLSDILYTDIAQATQIMAGGAGYLGGFNPQGWDIEDLGIEAYESKYGKASNVVEDVFRSQPGTIEASRMDLEAKEALSLQRLARASALEDQSLEKSSQDKKDISNLWFGTRVRNSKERSGLNEIEGYDNIMTIAENNNDQDTYDNALQASLQAKINLGTFYGELIGEDEKTRAQNAIANYDEFVTMQKLARYQYTQGKGISAEADFQTYQELVDAAWTHYQSISPDTVQGQEYRQRLDTIARDLLGMSKTQTFEKFVQENRKYYADNLLIDLVKNGSIDKNEIDSNVSELQWLDEFDFDGGDE